MRPTPGPYEVRNTGRSGVWKRRGDGYVKIATVEAPDVIPALAEDRRRGTCHLLAAAPELRNACEAVLETHGLEDEAAALEMARKALAKSRGEYE